MQKCGFTLISYCVLGRCLTFQTQIQDGHVKWKTSKMFYSMAELPGIDGEAIKFECNISPGFTTLQILQEIQDDLQKKNIKPEHFTDRIIFMSMLNDIEWAKRNIDETCISNSEEVKRFSRGHWTFVGLGDEKKRY